MANNAPVKIGKMALGEKEPVSLKRQGKVLLRLWKYLARFKGTLIAALLMTIASNLLALIGPKLSGEAVDAMAGGAGNVVFKKVFFYCAMMLVFYLFSALFSYFLNIMMIRLGKKVAKDMRRDLFNHLMELPVGYFDQYQVGDIININDDDIVFTVVPGGVTISTHIPGDINGDGNVNNKDLNRLMKYLADDSTEVVEDALDVNGDGNVNNKDLNRLMKYLADDSTEIH